MVVLFVDDGGMEVQVSQKISERKVSFAAREGTTVLERAGSAE